MAIITISRQYGSGGDEIATRVCEKLGYRYFDKTLMAQVASEMGLAEGVDFSEDNYKMRSFRERLFGTPRKVAQVGVLAEDATGAVTETVEILNEAQSVTMVQGAIEAAYQHGNMVIVGRGGQTVLKDKPDVLHVRIGAPLDDRVQRLHNRENYSLGWAQDRAVTRDRASAEYLQRFHGIDWADPLLYDLVINTGKLSIEAAAQLIVSAVGYLPPAEPA